MTCGKCGAGAGAIRSRSVYVEGGHRLEEINCILCGWFVDRPFFPQGKRAGLDLSRVAVGQHRRRRKQAETVACTREGCRGTFNAVNSKHRLCRDCTQKLWRWKSGRQNGPAPFIQTATGWIDNPERSQRNVANNG